MFCDILECSGEPLWRAILEPRADLYIVPYPRVIPRSRKCVRLSLPISDPDSFRFRVVGEFLVEAFPAKALIGPVQEKGDANAST